MTTSVAICTYNGEAFLQEQIDSILGQNVAVGEIIVCDDGSTDKTQSILKSYEKEFPEIFRIFFNEKKLGSVKNFEKAISLCKNDVIFLSDQDDVWLPQKVEKYLSYFRENPNVSVLCSNGFGINSKGQKLDVMTIWDVPEFIRKKKNEIDYFSMIAYIGNIATGASMAIKKTFLPEIIPFPEIANFHHDEWIALISSYHKKFELLNDKLFEYRVHEKQQVGGVFYPNKKKKRDNLTAYFDLSISDGKKFSDYKKQLKKLVSAHEKFQKLKNHSVARDFAAQQQKHIETLFQTFKEEMEKKHFLPALLLSITDKLLKKRQLKKND